MSDTQEQTGAGGDGAPVTVHKTGMLESVDVSERADVHKLRKGAIGIWGVLFLTVTGSAPISAMLFNTPIVVGFGNGVGAPAAFIFATVVLVIFSVGYVAMARKKTTAGGFYSYISHGLGREIGMGTGFGSVLAYSVFEASLCGGFAYFLNLKLAQFGVNVAWPWLALAMVLIISLLTYFDIRLSSIVLGIGLIGEIVMLLIFDGFMFGHGGLPMAAINPVNAFKALPASHGVAAGAIGVGLFFAFWSWVGFEMAPNYGEESKSPKRIVPRAMYISVIGLGIFYIITSWAPFAGYSSLNAAAHQAQTDAAHYRERDRRPVGRLAAQLPDHHRVLRLRDGLPQHHVEVLLLPRPRRAAAPAAGPDASQVEEPAHRVHHPVRHRGPDRHRVRGIHRIE